MNNPFYVSGAGEGLKGIGSMIQSYKQGEADQLKADETKAAQFEMQSLIEGGDDQAINAYMINNPEKQQEMTRAFGFKNESTRKNAADTAMMILDDSLSSDDAIRDRAAMVSMQGGDPADTLALLDMSEEERQDIARKSLQIIGSPEEREAYGVARSKSAMSAYQAAQIQESKDKTAIAGDRLILDVNKADQVIKDKEIAAGRKELDRIEGAEDNYLTITKTMDAVDELLNHSGFDAVGWSDFLPALPGSDESDFLSLVESLKGKQFLAEIKAMKGMGSLSDNEGKQLSRAAAALDTSMSETAFRKELERIKGLMEKSRNKISRRVPKGNYDSSDKDDTDTVEWGSLK
ncbi:MAG: hypothetical protein JKY50_22495 [Oleispira sp.]|nr:hypothetical protein [Oleispira sp.]